MSSTCSDNEAFYHRKFNLALFSVNDNSAFGTVVYISLNLLFVAFVFFFLKTSTTFYICILILFLFPFLYKYKKCVKSRKFVMINEQVMAFSCFIEICTRNSHTQRETESERYKTCPYKISSNENSGSVKLTEISTFFSINRSLTQM